MLPRSRFGAPLPAFVLALALSGPARADVRLAIAPDTLVVEPGATFVLELRVPVAGAVFNGYDAIVEYDPSALTFLPTSPTSLQEGAAMTGACGNTFHVFQAAGDSLSVSHSLLCANTWLAGPAQLYTLRFRAPIPPGSTRVRLRWAKFYDAGTFVNPVVTSDAFVRWGDVVSAVPPLRPPGLALVVRANPARGEQWFDVTSPRAGEQRVAVFDTAGRLVRALDSGPRAAGTRSVRWDGRDDRGAVVPAGLYLVRFEAAGRSARASVVRLP